MGRPKGSKGKPKVKAEDQTTETVSQEINTIIVPSAGGIREGKNPKFGRE